MRLAAQRIGWVATMLGLMVGASGRAEASVVIGGISFENDAFADTLISSSGSYTVSGAATLAIAVTDVDPGSYAFSFSPGAFLELGFVDNLVVNGAGADIALFELGSLDSFGVSLTIGGTTVVYQSTDTGDSAGGFNLNVAKVDLSDFGLGLGATVSSIVVGVDILNNNNNGTVPSLSLVGAINSTAPTVVPEPTTFVSGAVGMLMAAGACWRARRRRTAF